MGTNHHPQSIWSGDFLGRSQEAELLKTFLLRRIEERENLGKGRSFVLNIDAQWGSGKSFFLERFGEQLAKEGFLVANVNAWEDDYAADPMIPVLASIESAIEPLLDAKLLRLLAAVRASGVEISVSLARHSAKALVRRYFGSAVEDISDILSRQGKDTFEASVSEGGTKVINELIDRGSRAIIDSYRKERTASQLFEAKLAQLMKQVGNKNELHRQIFVLVDELDRCRPTYAIQMLERIKHLFNANGVVFVIATDTSQLRHSIKAVYGHGFDSARYLQRFFDRQYRFRDVSTLQFIKQLRSTNLSIRALSIPPIKADTPEGSFDHFVDKTIKGFELQLRDTQKALDILSDFITTWKHRAKIELAYLLPLICAELKKSGNALEVNGASTFLDEIRRGLNWSLVEESSPSGGRQHHSAWEFFEVLHSVRNLSLQEVSTALKVPTNLPTEWTRERLQEEYHLNHLGQCRAGQKIPSVLLEYPNRIESIEHLTFE